MLSEWSAAWSKWYFNAILLVGHDSDRSVSAQQLFYCVAQARGNLITRLRHV